MKQLLRLSLFVLISAFVFSCSQNNNSTTENENEVAEADFRNSLGASDSLSVLNQGDSIMSLLKSGNLESAFANLYEMDENGEVSALTETRKVQLARQFKLFPVQDFTRRDVQFNTAEQNIVIYEVIFDLASQSKTSFALSPVKKGGTWYFTVRGSSTADGHDMKANVVTAE